MRMLGAASTVFTLTLIFALAAPRSVTSTGSATTTTQLSGQDIYRNDTFGSEQLRLVLPARSAIQPSMTPLRQVSASGWTAGPTLAWMSEP